MTPSHGTRWVYSIPTQIHFPSKAFKVNPPLKFIFKGKKRRQNGTATFAVDCVVVGQRLLFNAIGPICP